MPSCRRYREVLRPIGWLVTENGDANVGSMPAATTSKHINIIMAKVLSYGKKHLYKYKVTCDHCGSVILLEQSEMEHEYDQREHDDWYSWNCPVCNKYHQIDGRKGVDQYKVIPEDIELNRL